jgi:hypothetical protein
MPKGCSATIAKGDDDAQSLSEAFKQQFGDAKYCGTMGQRVRV